MPVEEVVREHMSRVLAWGDAHVTFEAAVVDIPVAVRGERPAGAPHSPWEILEHLRITQKDILDFCVDSNYKDKEWPKDYWPASPQPPSEAAWDASIKTFQRDREAMQKLAQDSKVALEGKIPHGTGQTYLREYLLTIDHNAYHLGEMIVVRRLLGAWSG